MKLMDQVQFCSVQNMLQLRDQQELRFLPDLDSAQKTVLLEEIERVYCQLCNKCPGAAWINEQNLLIDQKGYAVAPERCPVENKTFQIV